MVDDLPDLLTVSQAAEALGLSRRGLHYRIERGDIHALQPSPRLFLVPKSEVERLRNTGKFRPGPKPKSPPGSSRVQSDEPNGGGHERPERGEE